MNKVYYYLIVSLLMVSISNAQPKTNASVKTIAHPNGTYDLVLNDGIINIVAYGENIFKLYYLVAP